MEIQLKHTHTPQYIVTVLVEECGFMILPIKSILISKCPCHSVLGTKEVHNRIFPFEKERKKRSYLLNYLLCQALLHRLSL